jgi:hypothetical protein
MDKRQILQKKGAELSPLHWKRPEVCSIIQAADACFPPGYDLVITRGMEPCTGGSLTSCHLWPLCAALDFRTRHLPPEIDREKIVRRMMVFLGAEYYTYFKIVKMANGQKKEWIHCQWTKAREEKDLKKNRIVIDPPL